jgi:hypothetical protein
LRQNRRGKSDRDQYPQGLTYEHESSSARNIIVL